jgi:hypothetical protein
MSVGLIRYSSYMVMEGRWNDFDVALFDYKRRGGLKYVGVIVSLPNDGTCFEIAVRALTSARGARVPLEDSGLASWVVISEPIPGSAAAAIGPQTAALLTTLSCAMVELALKEREAALALAGPTESRRRTDVRQQAKAFVNGKLP